MYAIGVDFDKAYSHMTVRPVFTAGAYCVAHTATRLEATGVG